MARTGIDITIPASPTAKVSARDVKTAGAEVWQQHVQTVEAGYDVTGTIQALTVDANAGGRALPTIPSDAEYALISLETAPIRWTDEATAPTAAIGHLLTPPTGDAVYFWLAGRARITAWRGFRTTGTSGAVQVTYYKARVPDA